MATGRGTSGIGRTIVLIFAGAALGTLIGSGVSKYGLLNKLVQPMLTLNFPLNTYVDFFFLTLSFGFTLKISGATILGGLFGYWIARKW
jgi:hypothetical protein